MNFSAIIVAAGSGQRAGDGPAKQWRLLGGRPVLQWSAQALAEAGASEIVVVIRPEDEAIAKACLSSLASPWKLVHGGATRAESVSAGLAVTSSTDAVLVHDAARPFVSRSIVERLLVELASAEGAIPALPVSDTLKKVSPHAVSTISRDGLWRAQTPQAFQRAALIEAYAACDDLTAATDDAAILEASGGRLKLIPGDARLMKLTYPEDFAMAEAIAGMMRSTRTGMGYDAHRLGPGDGVWLCGVKVPHTHGLIGHSDADVGQHALTDALLGAIGEGDIGQHFPPSDPQWKGASSDRFLRHAAELLRAKGGVIANVDVTLVCEAPKIGPHRLAMRQRLAEILDISIDRVSVKATTTEGMGFTGRREGIAAQAVATVSL